MRVVVCAIMAILVSSANAAMASGSPDLPPKWNRPYVCTSVGIMGVNFVDKDERWEEFSLSSPPVFVLRAYDPVADQSA